MRQNKRFLCLNKGDKTRCVFGGEEKAGCAGNVGKNPSSARVHVSSRCNAETQLVCYAHPGSTLLFHSVLHIQ